MKTKSIATLFALLAAGLYAINIPLSKLLLEHVNTTMMAAFLYLGAGMGIFIYRFAFRAFKQDRNKESLTKKDMPYIIAMVILDIIAPILLMFGIQKTNSANVSLLNNFEIVATSLIAFVIFKEAISKKLWTAILLVTAAGAILSFEGNSAFMFNEGSAYVLGACICWGFENNCTKMISNKDSEQIVMIKGCFFFFFSLCVALLLKEEIPAPGYLFMTMLLGFVSYGLSINFYIKAQKELGAAKTSAYYSIAPFLGAASGMLLLKERPEIQFYIALAIMIVSTVIMAKDTQRIQHNHEHMHIHTHMHSHGDFAHEHEHTHKHSHTHIHEGNTKEHSHYHVHISV